MTPGTPDPPSGVLSPEDSARLTEFARACKAAARAVILYPGGHPAITATIGRIVQVTSNTALQGPLRVSVLPDGLLVDGCAPVRADAALAELAVLLHSHLIGEMTINPGGDAEAWRQFLALLGRSPEAVRTDGGIARIWSAMGRHVELREIDYAEVLRERPGGDSARWESIIANCLQGDAVAFDDSGLEDFLGAVEDSDQLSALMHSLETRASSTGAVGVSAKTAAMMRMIRGIVDAVAKARPDRMEPVLDNMATAIGQLTPDAILALLADQSEGPNGSTVMNRIVGRMTDGTIARFVAGNVIADGTPTDRLAQAFQTLAPDEAHRERLLALAKDNVASSPLGATAGFESVWNHVAQKLLTSYSDKAYVPEDYGQELSAARTQAVEVEQVADDPPERIAVWLGTVATTAVRALDIELLLDLLRIEDDDERWGELMTPVVMLLEDLLLVGDFDAALQIVGFIATSAEPGGSKARRQHAMIAVDMVVAGSTLRHIINHLGTMDDGQFERVKTMCVSLGEVLVRPLAEALAVEERAKSRERLTAILLSFGTVARRQVERLKNAQNAAVRRTAIYLLREFGGSSALPDLTELLDDDEPEVQREAVGAILNIATDRAYRVLEQALMGGTPANREAIMRALAAMRDERATPLFTYILQRVSHRGPLAAVYLSAVESLGALRDANGVEPLKAALYKGEWWAPGRTSTLRAAAAAALARIGTPAALDVLQDAATNGSRGVRAAARGHADTLRRRLSREGAA